MLVGCGTAQWVGGERPECLLTGKIKAIATLLTYDFSTVSIEHFERLVGLENAVVEVAETPSYATDGPSAPDFYLTESPPSPLPPDHVAFPVNIVPILITYNIPGLAADPPLNLTLQLVSDLFRGVVADWFDPRVLALNPALAALRAANTTASALPVTRVVRSGSVPITKVLTTALFGAAGGFASDAGWANVSRAGAAPVVSAVGNMRQLVRVGCVAGALGYSRGVAAWDAVGVASPRAWSRPPPPPTSSSRPQACRPLTLPPRHLQPLPQFSSALQT